MAAVLTRHGARSRPCARRHVPFRLDRGRGSRRQRARCAGCCSELAFPTKIEERSSDSRVRGQIECESARDLNRGLLFAMRRVDRRTTLRAEWTSATPSSASSTTPQRNEIDLIARRCDGLACRRLCGCRGSRCPLGTRVPAVIATPAQLEGLSRSSVPRRRVARRSSRSRAFRARRRGDRRAVRPGAGAREVPSGRRVKRRRAMAQFSDRMVPEVVQVFWAAMARGEFVTAAAAEVGTYREKGNRWLRAEAGARPRRGRDLKGRRFDVRRARGDRARARGW